MEHTYFKNFKRCYSKCRLEAPYQKKKVFKSNFRLTTWAFLLFLQLFTNMEVYSQEPSLNVRGTVKDIKGEPLPGVSLKVRNSQVSTVTDAEGKYTLQIASPKAVIVFSYVGFVRQEHVLTKSTTLNVELIAESKNLEEVVVVGYGTQKKRDLTGSVASVGSQQIGQVVANNPIQALQGRVAGVNISQDSWRPGAGATVRIRGARSIRATNDPLYVIDGFPINRGETTLNDINPSDIESMEILKDASATAIYGSRGANGVILITTKKGKAGKTTVDYTAYEGFQEPLRTVDVWNGAEYAEYVRDSYRFKTDDIYRYNSPTANMDEDRANPTFSAHPYVLESVLQAYDANGNYDPSKVRSFDWMNSVMQDGRIQNHQLSVTGGSEKTKAVISVGYFGNKGVIQNMNYKRYNVRIGLDHSINSWLKVGSSTLISRVDENIGTNLYSLARVMSPLASPYDQDGNLSIYPANDNLMINPLLDIDGVIRDSRKNRLLTNFNVEANIIDGLKVRSNLGYDYRTARDGNFENAGTTPRNGGTSAFAFYGGNVTNDLLLENMLFYDKSFNGKHNLGVTLMQSTQSFRIESNGTGVKDLPYPSQQFYNIGSGATVDSYSSRLEKTRMLSFMGRINYNYLGRYLFTLTGRQDASSVLADGNKKQFFPSAAFAWRISDESFIRPFNFISDLKLRLSYGKIGNSSVAPYQTQGNLGLTRYVFDEELYIGYGPGLMPNPFLGWETSTTADLGLDFGFFKNRISGTVEAYRTNTSDLIMPRKLPITSGFPEVLSNVGKTRNTGIEVNLSAVNVASKNLNWKTTFIFSRNEEEITELIGGKVDDVGNEWFIGQPPLGVIFDQKAIGVWSNSPEDLAEIAKFNANGHRFEPGTVRLADKNGDYRITTDDRYILGSRRPKWTGGFASDLSYKQFDFSFQWYASYGGLGTFDKALQLNGRQNMVDVDYWLPTNQGNKIPKVDAGRLGPEYIFESYYEKVSYLRLKYVTLGYTVPDALRNKLRLSRLRIYASAQNPYLYSKFTGLDPEGAQGFETPSVKTFMLGINASF